MGVAQTGEVWAEGFKAGSIFSNMAKLPDVRQFETLESEVEFLLGLKHSRGLKINSNSSTSIDNMQGIVSISQ